jgi:uncharacterized membrane protein
MLRRQDGAFRDDDMIVLVVLFSALFFFRLLGVAGVGLFATWIESARVALATMFLFTSISHFGPMKKDLIAMVPPALPRPDLLVTFTGIAELAGAAGVLVARTTLWAAWGMILLLALMLPANVSAVRRGVLLRGKPATALWLRVPMQLLLILWAWLVR